MLSYSSYHIVSIIYVTFLLAIMGLGFAVFNFYWEALIGLVCAALGFLLGAGFSNLNLAVAGLIILLGLYSRMNISREVSQRIKVKSRGIIGAGLMPLIIAMAMGVSVIGYQSGLLADLAQEERVPSASESFVKSIIGKLINSNVKIDTNGIRKSIVNITPTTDENLKKNIINEATKSVLGDVNSTLKPYFKYAKIIGATSLFLILMSLSWIFYWLTIWTGMLLLIIFRITGLIWVEERDIKAERLMV